MKVLFVCSANTCRSPMLEYMFKAYLKARGKDDVQVDSAGLLLSNDKINPLCLATLDKHGVPYFDKQSQFCTKQLYKKADWVFVMTPYHAQVLKANYGAKRNMFILSDLLETDIDDPYGQGIEAYEKTYLTFWNNLDRIYRTIYKTDD